VNTAELANEQRARRSVKVKIDELVLHGFASGDRNRIAAAVEGELTRLIGEGGRLRVAQNALPLGRIDGGAFTVKAGSRPQSTGTQIAQALYRSLQQGSFRRQTRSSASATPAPPGTGSQNR
jgi:hypothetical protein